MVEWQEQVEKLKDHRAKWTARRKVMEEALSRQEHIAKVLDWIKKGDDPEQSLRALNDRATSEGRQKDSASWILDNQIFKAWSQNLYPPEPPVSTTSDVVSKRVLWVSGSYGVGKTTIVHRVVSELQKLADGYLPRDDVLQVISYFCDTSKRANYETVIRSIGRKLSLLPDFTIARKAQDFYNKHTSGLTATIYIKEYEDLVRDLLNERSKSYNIVLLIDALNECDPFQDAERLCAFISEIVSKNPQVWVLFSSHEQLSGSEQFKEMHLEKMEVVANAPGNALEDFVRTEIKFREDKLKDSRSIFLNSDHKDLLVTLEQSLIDRAKGMTVVLKDNAQELLKDLQETSTKKSEANGQLQAGYQKLWDSGSLTRFDEIRKRLFRFVLCAFEPLKLSTVAHASRIGIEENEPSYRGEITIEDIDKVCSNFLSKDVSGHLSWTHDSARNFVVRVILDPGIGLEGTSAEETSMKSSHLAVANTFIAVMKDSDHQVWKEADLDPSEWMLPKREFKPDSQKKIDSTRVMMKISNAKSSLGYLGRHGWRHCELAADKHVISDPLWTRVLRELLLHPKTAFALWWQIWFKDPLHPWEPGYRYLEEILGDYAGERVILISHALVFLKLKTDSVWDVQLEKAAKAPLGRSIEEDLAESLVRHAACKNLNGANALHLACEANNGSLLNLMLQAILQRPGGVARVFELLEEEYKSQTPFIWAIKFEVDWAHPQSSYDFDVKGGFLRFENDNPRPNGCDQSSNEAASLCLWSQSCKSWSDFETALMQALYWLEENEVIRLLDIHKPCNIDVQAGNSKRTVLHLAAMDGKIQLVKVLVEECDANVDVRDGEDKTPLHAARETLAFRRRTHSVMSTSFIEENLELARVIEYLESINQSDSGEMARRIR
ncbi:hypothetical protein HO133_001635 [Letharia lupina]|uniref:Nephrocystin 3-like N-terminal domain-containing protein n=1 Tax=Letharia lupina TaxID=560253 RepID=A0A8H6CDW5_9LECA|nr:uncharacterized protein HO133_001635 [Letharia lupina]KAF6221667.1 hypothetical protein HO133_001635 [Letharia lupina]